MDRVLAERSPVQCPGAASLNLAGEANAKLCMSHLIVEVQVVGLRVPTPSSMKHMQPPAGFLSCPQKDLPYTDSGVLVWYTGIPA